MQGEQRFGHLDIVGEIRPALVLLGVPEAAARQRAIVQSPARRADCKVARFDHAGRVVIGEQTRNGLRGLAGVKPRSTPGSPSLMPSDA